MLHFQAELVFGFHTHPKHPEKQLHKCFLLPLITKPLCAHLSFPSSHTVGTFVTSSHFKPVTLLHSYLFRLYILRVPYMELFITCILQLIFHASASSASPPLTLQLFWPRQWRARQPEEFMSVEKQQTVESEHTVLRSWQSSADRQSLRVGC